MQNNNKRIVGSGNIPVENLSVNALAKKMLENAPLKVAVVCLVSQILKPKEKLRAIAESMEVLEELRKNILGMDTRQAKKVKPSKRARVTAPAESIYARGVNE